MKVKALKLLFLVAAVVCLATASLATNYYISNSSGSDSNPGTIELPWKTVAKVNAMMPYFIPGDSILFKRGETWANSSLNITKGGSGLGGYLTFGAYGTGDRPIIYAGTSATLAAINCSTPSTSYVHIDGLHVYSIKSSPRTHANGILIRPLSLTTFSYNWWISDCEVSEADQNGLQISYVDTYVIEDCELHGSRLKPLCVLGTDTCSVKNGTIDNCIIYDSEFEGIIGFHAENGHFDGPLTGPNHLVTNCELYGDPQTAIDLALAQYVTFRNCYVEGGITGLVSTGGGTHDFTFDKCFFVSSTYGCMFQSNQTYGTTDNVVFTNNIVIMKGERTAFTIGGDDYVINNNTFLLDNETGRWIDFYTTNNSTHIAAKNNIISYSGRSAEPSVIRFLNPAQDPDDVGRWDYNWYYYPLSAAKFYVAKNGTTNSYSSWKSTWSQDAHSSVDTVTDPRLENGSGDWSLDTDFRLRGESPCRGTGVWVEITSDYFGNPVSNPPDIGACAYIFIAGLFASASASPTSGQAPLTVSFRGSATGGTEPYTYSWSFGDGQSSSSQNPSHTYNSSGTFTANLTVKDSKNAVDSKSMNITVTSSVSPLIATANANPVSGQAPLAVNFTGSAIGGTPPYSYTWNFGDGQSSSSQNPSHTYNSSGTYIAILTVADSQGVKDDHSLTITATAPGSTTYDLAISSATGSPAPGQGGTTDPSPGNHTYSAGSSILVASISNENYRFSRWKGELGTLNPFLSQIAVLLDKAISISANFCTKCGDVTGDLAISPADAQKTFDIYLKKIPNPTECEIENADVNGSGTPTDPQITPADAQAIFNKYLNKGEFPSDCSGTSRMAAASAQVQTAPPGQVHLMINDVTLRPNQDLLVPIIIDSSFDITAFGFDLTFPPETLVFVGVEKTDFSEDFDQIGAAEIENGTLRVGGYTTHPVPQTSSKVLVTLVFRVIGEMATTSSFSIVNTFDDLRQAQVRNGLIHQKAQAQRRPSREFGGKRYDL